jgi:MFS family permease
MLNMTINTPEPTRLATSYKWYVLALAALTHTLVVGMPTMSLPVLFKEISDELNLSLVQVGMIWSIGSFTGIFMGLVGGSLGDRFGTRRTLMVACALAGLAGALRAFTTSMPTYVVAEFLYGLVIPMIPMNVHKTCGVWFSGKRPSTRLRASLGLANGVASGGMALGFMLGSLISTTLLSPLLGGWRNVLILYGIIALAMSIPWYFSREEPADEESPVARVAGIPPRQAFAHVVRLRNVWILGLAILGQGACVQGMLGYLPLYLRDSGWPEAQADGALAAFHAVSLLAVIPIALLSDQLGSRKRVLMLATLMLTVGVGLLSVVDGALVWPAVVIAGLMRDGYMAVFFTTLMEVPGVGAVYAGTASGVGSIFLRLGGVASPPLGNSLARFDPDLPFVFWAILGFVGWLVLFLLEETANHEK